jgi:zinc protease
MKPKMAELFERGSLSLTKDELSMKTEILASDIEGYSGKNTVGMKLLGPSANLNELVDIFSDVLCNPLFLDDELDIVKKDILSYLNRKKQNYAALAADKFYELLFPNHPYSMNQYGSESSVLEISRREISEAYKGSIFKSNFLLSAVGNFDLDELVKCLDMSLDIKNPESNIKKDLEFTPIKEDKIFETKLGDKQQSHIMIGTYAPSLESNDQYAFQVMNSCLSGMGGRLFVELRDKQSLAYTVSSFYSPAPSIGHFGVYIGCSPEKKDQSIDAINLEISNLVSNGVTKSEIERAKNYLIGRNDISLQRNSAINARICQGTFFGLGPEEPFEFSSKIRSVSLDEVNHVISKYLKNSNKVIVAFQPS